MNIHGVSHCNVTCIVLNILLQIKTTPYISLMEILDDLKRL